MHVLVFYFHKNGKNENNATETQMSYCYRGISLHLLHNICLASLSQRKGRYGRTAGLPHSRSQFTWLDGEATDNRPRRTGVAIVRQIHYVCTKNSYLKNRKLNKDILERRNPNTIFTLLLKKCNFIPASLLN